MTSLRHRFEPFNYSKSVTQPTAGAIPGQTLYKIVLHHIQRQLKVTEHHSNPNNRGVYMMTVWKNYSALVLSS